VSGDTRVEVPFSAIKATLKKAVGALRAADVPFMLGGGLAVWARGGPNTDHDLDLMIRPRDAERALSALEAEGMQAEHPPEHWLVKAWDGEVLVDLIYEPSGMIVDDEVFARAEELDVYALRLLVMRLEDVLVTKLSAMGEHQLDYEAVLEIARSLREQIDWQDVRIRTASSPYARAFFTLVEGLDVVPPALYDATSTGTAGGRRASAAGRSKTNVDPSPSDELSQIEPPIRWTSSRQM
jgi:predicted nucleotidyltransferase